MQTTIEINDFKLQKKIEALVHAWCRSQYEERTQADNAKQRRDAQIQLDQAQRTIDRLSGKV